MAKGGIRPGAGRKPGIPNRATREIKALAQEYSERAVATLSEIMLETGSPAGARVTAAIALLDRGHGKPTQYIEGEFGVNLGVDEDVASDIARIFGLAPNAERVADDAGGGGAVVPHKARPSRKARSGRARTSY
jgi:hypothetical protein